MHGAGASIGAAKRTPKGKKFKRKWKGRKEKLKYKQRERNLGN